MDARYVAGGLGIKYELMKARKRNNRGKLSRISAAFFQRKEENNGFFAQKNNLQTKLKVGSPDDKYEREADAMAKRVVAGADSSRSLNSRSATINRKCASCEAEEKMALPKLQRMEEEEEVQARPEIMRMEEEEEELQARPMIQKMEEEEEEIQAKPDIHLREKRDYSEGFVDDDDQMYQSRIQTKDDDRDELENNDGGALVADDDIQRKLDQSKGGGKPLSAPVKTDMESSFGTDFSGVRVHTDDKAVQMNQQLKAQAFTHGKDVYFNQGKYNPESAGGKELLAHELTHVVQQNRGLSRKIQRAKTAEVSNAMSDDPYGWTSSYKVKVNKSNVTITVKVKIVRDADVTKKDQKKVANDTKNEFLRYYDQRFDFVDDKGKSRKLKVNLKYVNSGEHLTINLHSGHGHDNLSNWYVDSDSVTRAHEMGHQLGFKDEYIDAAAPNRANKDAPGVKTDNSIMGNYYTEGIGKADVKSRHGDQLATDVSAATGMSFTAKWSDTYVVRKGDTLWGIALRIYGDGNKWKDIHALNKKKIKDPDKIYPNQVIKLPPRT